jgi:hypothetical protein
MSAEFAELDAALAALRNRVTELAVSNQMLADRTEETRQRLQERMDVLESFMGQTIDRLADHATNPDAHAEDGS